MKSPITRWLPGLCFLLTASLISQPLLAQTVRYVKPTATGSGNGSSWANASASLQAIINASASGDQVWVAQGTYKPTTSTDRTISFNLKNGVAIYGGFVGSEPTLSQRPTINNTTPSSTTLSGDIGTLGNNIDNSYHVIFNLPGPNNPGLTNSAILDGFVVTGGNANQEPNNLGGGIFNVGTSGNTSSPLIRSCTFVANGAGSGGAIFNAGSSSGNSSPVITSCVFQSNTAGNGAAIYNDGGSSGTSSPLLTNCLFAGNRAFGVGGVIYNSGSGGTSSPRLTNCAFQSNTALQGGVMYSSGGSSGTSSPVLTNCSFQSNTSLINQGGGLYNNGVGGTSSTQLLNCVLWNNGGANTLFNNSATVTASYSLFETTVTGYTSVTGNLTTTTTPFASTTGTQLGAGSVAINAGDPATTSTTGAPAAVGITDLAGNTRFVGGRIDMGAYEFCTPASRLYVWASASGANTGLSWTDAFTDLQSALSYPCSQSLTEIWVAGGTYKPTATTDRDISFAMRSGVAIYGGFMGSETTLSGRPAINATTPSSSTLSGEIGSPSSTTDNSRHVISNSAGLTNTAILDGFVLTACNSGDVGGAMINDGFGGGQVCSPTIRNCLFIANTALRGGAIYNRGQSGGNSSPRLINCSFVNNSASNGGGAIWNGGNNSGTSTPQLINCSFINNSATGFGGGAIFNDGSSSGNSSPQLTNCSFANNSANQGGAISGQGVTSIPGNANTQLINCVFFNNGGGNTFYNDGATITASYSLFDNTVSGYTSGGSILTTTTSPFASTTSTQLGAGSPAINTGDPATTTATVGITDLAGNPRFLGGRIDMGAYEFCAPVTRLYVKAGAANTGDGSSWATAFPNLQTALSYPCSQNLTEIWVALGTYKPTSTTARDISFAMRNGVAIYGGFMGSETSLSLRPAINATAPSSTTLSGDIGTVGNNADNAYHVINNPPGLTNSAILDGFVITGGNANDSYPNDIGGGMLNNGEGSGNVCSPLIRQCVFVANRAKYGGAIDNEGPLSGSSSPRLTNCVFLSNTATAAGGAIYNYGETSGNSSPVLTNCAFQNNTATQGGAMINNGNDSGISSPVLTNCSFQNNTADLGGVLGSAGSSSNPQLINCILWNNGGANTIVNINATVTASYSLFDASVTDYTSGPGNLTVTTSPFASTTSTQLAPTSPAINSGNPATTTATVGTTDLAGTPRIAQGRIDMGAFEWGTTCQGLVTSLKAGNWNDTTVWSCNVVPSTTDIVQLNHVVTLPANTTAQIKTLRNSNTGKLTYQTGAKLKLGF